MPGSEEALCTQPDGQHASIAAHIVQLTSAKHASLAGGTVICWYADFRNVASNGMKTHACLELEDVARFNCALHVSGM